MTETGGDWWGARFGGETAARQRSEREARGQGLKDFATGEFGVHEEKDSVSGPLWERFYTPTRLMPPSLSGYKTPPTLKNHGNTRTFRLRKCTSLPGSCPCKAKVPCAT